jgi:hypothetical protein
MNLPVVLKRTMTVVSGLSLLAATLLGGCGKPASEAVDRPNLLVATDGDVRLKRVGWSDYVPVGFGTFLQSKDLLEVDGTASVLCGDLTVKPIKGRDSCPCPTTMNHVMYDDANISIETSRCLEDDRPEDDVPYITHPRNTLVASPRPLLRWRDVGASSYTIAIVQRGSVIWQQDGMMGDEITYPADGPTLEPGVDYLLVVRDNDTGIESSEDPAKGIGFRVASSAQREALAAHCDDVTVLPDLDDTAHNYALALCYATWEPEGGGHRLWGAAWLLLESVLETHDAPAVHLWTGDMLSVMKLPNEAETAYQMALEQAEALGDLESQAAAHAGLWRVTGDEVHWDKAMELYTYLGDDAAQRALEEEK